MAAIYSQIFEDVSWLHFAVTWGQSLLIIRFVVYITSLLHLVAFFFFWSSNYSRSLPVTSNNIALHFITFHCITLTSLITRSAHVSLLPSQATSRDTLTFMLRVTCDSDIDVRVHTALKLPLKSIWINLIIRMYITRMNISWFFD